MKKVEGNTSGSANQWQNDLLKDLTFIKAKKRYPLSRKTFAPATLMGLLALAMLRIAWPLYFTRNVQNPIIFWGTILFVILLVIFVFRRYYSVLKFDTINTPYFTQENMVVLKQFLTQNHLAFTQNNDAPEVFLIISRNLDANPDGDHREVMVFIADDKQVLINSHYVGSKKFSITPPSRNYKSMANMLRKWLNEHISNADSSAAVLSRF